MESGRLAGSGQLLRFVPALAIGPDFEVVVVDAATGEQLWSQPGRESYCDMWAIGDGAVEAAFVP